MLIAIDLGNSQITIGVFSNGDLLSETRIDTDKTGTTASYRETLQALNIQHVDGVCIGSVVPELDEIFTTLSREIFHADPLFVSTKLKTTIANFSEKESGLGADRLADIVAAAALYQGNRIVIDLGTASKFEAISEQNEYRGGAIGPGIGTSFDALIKNASKLSHIELTPPKQVVGGFTTQEHLTSGFVHGFASMTDGMIQRMREELQWHTPTVILTGGFTDLISPFLTEKVTVNKTLVLEGLRLLWESNK